ncbi:MAG: hypothetical protein AABY42_04640 [Nitrospirota bacterium]
MLIDYMGIEVSNISYSGNDEYRIEIIMMNNSKQNIMVTGFEKRFYVQTDTGRDLLSDRITDSLSGILYSTAQRKMIVIAKVPLDMPQLYRTYEGDVSLILTYRLRFTADSGKEVFTKSGDEYYWISPRTDRWIHREGM